jgi:hypothetical protein
MHYFAAAGTAVVFALTAAAAVGQSDRIVWTDGTSTTECRVTGFTWREIKYTQRGNEETRSADAVARLEVEKVKELYKRAYGATSDDEAYAQFRKIAESLTKSNPFAAQFGFIEGARLLVKNREYNEAFALLEKLATELPDSGFRPEVFRMKLQYYLGQGKDGAENAKTVAKKYASTALTEGWPEGFAVEASYYDLMARAAAGDAAGAALQAELKALLTKVEGRLPSVTDRVKVQLAHALRAEGKLDEARQAYEEIIDKEGVDPSTLAQAFLGTGYAHMQAGDPKNTEPYRDALLAFLRVFLETPGASSEAIAEALYQGAESAEKWRGPDSGAMARRLRAYLRRDYAETAWGQKR